MQAKYKVIPDETLDGRRIFHVVADRRREGNRPFLVTYTNAHSADALVRLLNNLKDHEV